MQQPVVYAEVPVFLLSIRGNNRSNLLCVSSVDGSLCIAGIYTIAGQPENSARLIINTVIVSYAPLCTCVV